MNFIQFHVRQYTLLSLIDLMDYQCQLNRAYWYPLLTRFTVSLGTIGSIFCSRLQPSARQLTWSIIIAITMVIHKNVRTRQVESYPDSRLRIRPTL